jgi:hypothetical protein
LEGDAVNHFERRGRASWALVVILLLVAALGVGWAYTAVRAQEARARAEEALAAEQARQQAEQAKKAAPLPQRHFLEKGKSYTFVWQNERIGPAVVLEELRDNWVKVRVPPEDMDQWVNLSTVQRFWVIPEAKGGKDTDKGAAEAKATVQGVVTFNGKPVANGRVSFHPEKGKAVEAETNEDGIYSAKDVPVGSLWVTVTAKRLPEKYAGKDQTPLRFQVQKGVNQVDIALMQ